MGYIVVFCLWERADSGILSSSRSKQQWPQCHARTYIIHIHHTSARSSKPNHTQHQVHPLLLCAGVLERPHAVARHVPVCARCSVHPASSCRFRVPICAAVFLGLGLGLLDDRAGDVEAVLCRGGRGGGFSLLGGSGCRGDEGLEDCILVVLSVRTYGEYLGPRFLRMLLRRTIIWELH